MRICDYHMMLHDLSATFLNEYLEHLSKHKKPKRTRISLLSAKHHVYFVRPFLYESDEPAIPKVYMYIQNTLSKQSLLK